MYGTTSNPVRVLGAAAVAGGGGLAATGSSSLFLATVGLVVVLTGLVLALVARHVQHDG